MFSDIKQPEKEKEKRIKVSLKELPKKEPAVKQKAPVMEKIPPMPKGSQLEKLVKQEPIKYEPKAKPKKPTLNKKPKPKKQEKKVNKTEPLPPQKPFIPLAPEHKEVIKKQEKKDEDPLYSLLSEDKSSDEPKEVVTHSSRMGAGGTMRDMKKLYGDEWGKLTPGQKEYMLDNLEVMRRITQEVLNRQARVSNINDINVNRTNVIEFYLHPNGDMSDFKFLSKSGYYILDDITKATISYAYSKYPRPKEKILIRYNVFYNLARY